jgi:hypothetical protein
VYTQKHAQVSAKKNTAGMNAQKHAKVNADKKC